jgi:pyrroline-5-carboxylate reductase
MLTSQSIGFLGAGKMASALAKGFIRAGCVAASQVVASDPSEAARANFGQEAGTRVTASNIEVATSAATIILAVKPDMVLGLLEQVRPYLTDQQLVLSIVGGVPTRKIEDALFEGARVVRVMPNTPALVGACASAFTRGEFATEEDARTTERLLGSVGIVYEVKEKLMDSVTGLSGSGPAYVFQVIEALSDGGVAVGLPRDMAIRLAAQTVLGSAKMVLETGLHPAVLKDMVCSPGGTTIEGVLAIEKGGVRAAMIEAVRASAEKAVKIGQG